MYAVVVRETGDAAAIDASREHVQTNVVPRTQQARGILAAYWTTDKAGGTLNMLLFDEEAAARAAMERIRDAPRPPFMRLESVQLNEVLAHF